ncbi:MAG: DUF2461 domain-containing protein [Flavobacteriales bacterium]|nr:DUF2461 domain-containing protein [Flavobacteriales bacterium]
MSNPFTSDFHSFFIELAGNNHKDWFHANKKRYETSVKKPFEAFVAMAYDELKKEGIEIDLKPGDAIFRINRDIRFSKDKNPYKLNRSAIISPFGRKNKSYPGLYIDFGPEKIWIGGGAYFMDKEQLYDLRDHIQKQPKKLRKALINTEFKRLFPQGLQGDKNKIIPKEFKPSLETSPEIANKQFYYMSEHSPDLLLEDNLLETVIEHWKASRDLETLLIEGMFPKQ